MPKTIYKKNNLKDIQTELELIRSSVISLSIKDDEGEYKPEFVRRALKSVQEKPTEIFTNVKDFLRQISKK